jgi:nucleoside-diphosphate-sugar epimerase
MPSYCGKRVLVTGANGFIGSHLVARLMSEGAQVTCVLRPSSACWRFERLRVAPEIIRAELDDIVDLDIKLASQNPEFVFHLVAERDHAKLACAEVEKSGICFGSNVLECVNSAHLQRFISLGTSLEVQGAITGQPIGLHGRAKLRELHRLRETATKLGARFSPTRTHYVYGPLQSPEKLIPTAIKAGRNGSALELTAGDIGKRFIYVGDIVDALLQIPNQPASPNEVKLITSDHNMTNLSVVKKIAELMGKPIQIKLDTFSKREFDRQSWGVSDAGSRVTDWTATTSLDQGLQACIDAAEEANAQSC